ncbi:MAG TPA: hypothetical protein VM204_07190 [Gaiellaceae bacterium]|nr:hypothetical protein [Gaiellaceae bacterium]
MLKDDIETTLCSRGTQAPESKTHIFVTTPRRRLVFDAPTVVVDDGPEPAASERAAPRGGTTTPAAPPFLFLAGLAVGLAVAVLLGQARGRPASRDLLDPCATRAVAAGGGCLP